MEPLLFALFAIVLGGVAVDHHRRYHYALGGLALGIAMKFLVTPGGFNLVGHFGHEAETVLNLFGLLTGFGALARHFENSKVPQWIPRILPDNWLGYFLLLIIVFVLSSFLDNIAAAVIGGLVASAVSNKKVMVGYVAAIVFASNAGGSGSVIGDTTTTMAWLAGYSAFDMTHAYVAAVPAVLFSAFFAARAQQAYEPIQCTSEDSVVQIDWSSLFVVTLILIGAVAGNIMIGFPAVGVWAAILVGWFWRKPDWHEVREQAIGAVFLLSLVMLASIMPIHIMAEHLGASTNVTFGLGILSAGFDNIPLTALALKQGGYDVGFLAYAVGTGGSMTWLGSSAGVAITQKEEFSAGHDMKRWVTEGWHVLVGFAIGYLILALFYGWHPHAPH